MGVKDPLLRRVLAQYQVRKVTSGSAISFSRHLTTDDEFYFGAVVATSQYRVEKFMGSSWEVHGAGGGVVKIIQQV